MTKVEAHAEAAGQDGADKRYMAFEPGPEAAGQVLHLHMVVAKPDKRGLCAPAANRTACGQVQLKMLAPVNGYGYDAAGMREVAFVFGPRFCGRCVAALYADKP